MTRKTPTAAELAEEIKRLALPFHYDEGRNPIERRMSQSELRLCELIDKLSAMAKAAEGAERLAQRDTMTLQEVWDLAGGAHAMEGPTRHQVELLLHELDAPRPQQDETGLLRLVCDIRFAVGDNGKRMQPELVEYMKALKTNSDRYEFMRDTDDAMWRPFGLRHGGDAAKADAAIDAARGIGGAR